MMLVGNRTSYLVVLVHVKEGVKNMSDTRGQDGEVWMCEFRCA